MFNGEESINIRTSEPLARVVEKAEHCLDNVGRVSIRNSGDFTISSPRFTSFAHETKIEGWIEERREGEYRITAKYTVNPTPTGIVLLIVMAVFFLPLVILPIILVMNSQSELKRALSRAMDDIQDQLERRVGDEKPIGTDTDAIP